MTVAATRRMRLAGFTVVAVLVVAVGGVYLVQALRDRAAVTSTSATDVRRDLPAVLDQPHVVFRSTRLDAEYGRVAAVPLTRPDGPRAVAALDCERIDVGPERGVCLSADRGAVTTYSARVVRPDLTVGADLTLRGLPSRARVADDGALVTTTTFVTGHSYAAANFSTEALVHRLGPDGRPAGAPLNLETFRMVLDGRVNTAVDRNVWGVTFAGGDRFYATVATGGRTWLVAGDLRRRTLTSLRGNAECPSLSPDGTRVAYKRRVDGGRWRLHVLDLTSMSDHAVAERRSVDDQVEWLDDDRLLYGLPRAESAVTDVWVVPARGGTPKRFIEGAWSPSVVR